MAPFRTGRAPGHYTMPLPDRMRKLNKPMARHRSSARELCGRACYGRFLRWTLCSAPCGAEMKIISVITDFRLVDRILRYLRNPTCTTRDPETAAKRLC